MLVESVDVIFGEIKKKTESLLEIRSKPPLVLGNFRFIPQGSEFFEQLPLNETSSER